MNAAPARDLGQPHTRATRFSSAVLYGTSSELAFTQDDFMAQNT